MRTRQGSTLQSLRAAKSFIDEHADQLPGVTQAGARKRLDDAIAALDGHASDQTGHTVAAQGLTQKQRALRVTLLQDHMRAIARIATADLPNTPEFADLRMPRGRPTPEKLAAAANGMAKVAAPRLAVFTAAGLPEDFITQLNTAVASMLGALTDRTRTQSRRMGATTGLREKLTEGRKVVGILDALVRTALKGNTVLLRDWTNVIHIRGFTAPLTLPDRESSTTTTASPPPIPVPGTPGIAAAPASAPADAHIAEAQ